MKLHYDNVSMSTIYHTEDPREQTKHLVLVVVYDGLPSVLWNLLSSSIFHLLDSKDVAHKQHHMHHLGTSSARKVSALSEPPL